MGKLILIDHGQTYLAEDFFSHDTSITVQGTQCFPKIEADSGDFFFVTLIGQPDSNCHGKAFVQELKVVATSVKEWSVERMSAPCGGAMGRDFNKNDKVQARISSHVLNSLFPEGTRVGV